MMDGSIGMRFGVLRDWVRTVVVVLAGAVASLASGCGEDAEVIRVGLVPTEGGADTQERFGPLEDHLRESLGREVELISASHYQGVIVAMANKQIDFAWLGPKSYVEAADRANAEALVLEVSIHGDPGYHSVFIVPSDSEVQTLADARGKRFAFTDANSTSGCLIPKLVLRDLFETDAESFFSEVRFSGSHSTSAMQVSKGEVDIAAVGDIDLRKLLDTGNVSADSIRVVHRSDLIPGSPLAARGDLPASLKESFREAMLALNDEPETLARFQIGGYQRADDSTYDIIRTVKALLEQTAEASP